MYKLVEGKYGFCFGAMAFVIGISLASLLWHGFWKIYDYWYSKK